MRKLLSVLLCLCLLATPVFASGEASGSRERDIRPWPSLQSGVYTAAAGEQEAEFLCYGVFDELDAE